MRKPVDTGISSTLRMRFNPLFHIATPSPDGQSGDVSIISEHQVQPEIRNILHR